MPDWITATDVNHAQVAFEDGLVLVRDSRRPSVVLRFAAADWAAFLESARRGDFDTPDPAMEA